MSNPDRRRPPSRRRLKPPPIPPGLVAPLRDAGKAIDPGRVYMMKMPDGGMYVAKGGELIETAEAMISLADALAAGDDAAARQALAQIGLSDPAGRSVVLCTRVGQAACPIPPGYLTANCHGCGAAVWISPENHVLVAKHGARALCHDCMIDP